MPGTVGVMMAPVNILARHHWIHSMALIRLTAMTWIPRPGRTPEPSRADPRNTRQSRVASRMLPGVRHRFPRRNAMKSKASVKKAKGVAKRDLTPRTRVVGGNAVLTNIANMNHESLKAIAQNLRG